MSQLSVNDLFQEIFDENERLIDEFSVNKRYVDVLQKYRQLLTNICSESGSSEDTELRQRYLELENEYKCVDKEIKTIIAETERKATELRNQMNIDSEDKQRMSSKKKSFGEEEEEMSAAEDLDQNKTNVKFLSAKATLLEEDGTVITKRDANNPLILVVRMNDSSKQVFGFRCNWSDCQYVSVLKAKVDTHLRTVHDRNGLFLCQKCKQKFVSQKLLSTHQTVDHSNEFKCDYDDCPFRCRTRRQLNEHMRRHTGEKPNVCPVPDCRKAFSTRQELRRHNNAVHEKESHRCDWIGCGLSFTTQKGLSSHQMTHVLN